MEGAAGPFRRRGGKGNPAWRPEDSLLRRAALFTHWTAAGLTHWREPPPAASTLLCVCVCGGGPSSLPTHTHPASLPPITGQSSTSDLMNF